jgi:hypothetical protein
MRNRVTILVIIAKIDPPRFFIIQYPGNLADFSGDLGPSVSSLYRNKKQTPSLLLPFPRNTRLIVHCGEATRVDKKSSRIPRIFPRRTRIVHQEVSCFISYSDRAISNLRATAGHIASIDCDNGVTNS